MVCSWDGSVAYADFTAEELGRPMSEEEKVFPSHYPASNLST